MLIDTHAHLQSEEFKDDWREVLDRAGEQSVTHVILPGSDLDDSRRALAMAAADDRLFCSIGVHPHEAKYFSGDTESALEALIQAAPEGNWLLSEKSGWIIIMIYRRGRCSSRSFALRSSLRPVMICL
jgi:Tat protein secretion system quality control protein TatD with DNase activity